MFDLERAIQQWRERMARSGVTRGEVLDELESHMREAVAAQTRAGLGVEPAFQAAVRQIGSERELNAEFRKARTAERLRDWFMVAAVSMYALIGGGCSLFRLGSFAETTSLQQVLALTAVALMALLLFAARLGQRWFPVVSNQYRRLAIYAVGTTIVFLWLWICYQLVMTRLELQMHQLVVALLWAMIPLGALGGMIHGFESAAERAERV